VPATLDWYGCATFRLTIDDLVVFLDAYIDRAPGAPGTGLTADDIDRADWILVGHSHFDHLWGAERIAEHGRHDRGFVRDGSGDGGAGRADRAAHAGRGR
jgi:L-ascorbate metabolism protein UlaG (beta-lactamase superfamily)